MSHNLANDWLTVGEFLVSRVKRAGTCWNWPWNPNPNRTSRHHYASVRVAGRWWRLNRLMWTLVHGTIPPRAQVCHSCDNTRCINPAHLWVGTNRANAIDREIKKRGRWTKSWPAQSEAAQ